MSMLGDAVRCTVVQAVVQNIEALLEKYSNDERVSADLKELGRNAMAQLQHMHKEEWEERYRKLFS